MSIAARLLNGGHDIRYEATTPGPLDDFWYRTIDGFAAGRPVTPDAAMRVSAWYACMTVLTDARVFEQGYVCRDCGLPPQVEDEPRPGWCLPTCGHRGPG